MSDRIRAALQRLTELDGHTIVDCTADWAEAMIEARAALAEPVGKPAPSAEGEVGELVAWLHGQDGGIERRAIYSRIADLLERQAAPPAAGEVGELVAWLRETGDLIQPSHLAEHQRYKRAADLLERQAAPVPVSERLPGPEDCDAEGFCWFWSPEDQCWFWERQDSTFCRNYGTEFHWLPATALPLPSGEVQP